MSKRDHLPVILDSINLLRKVHGDLAGEGSGTGGDRAIAKYGRLGSNPSLNNIVWHINNYAFPMSSNRCSYL